MRESLVLAGGAHGYRARPAAVPAHLRPSAPTAAAALLCGDPARALAIAQALLVKPRMSNHHRGLWGYHGETAAGAELTVQATGIGGPSAAIVIGELSGLGMRRAIRVGTCAAPAADPPLGAKLVVERAIAGDGTSRALGAEPGEPLFPDRAMTVALASAPELGPATVLSRDLPPMPGEPPTGIDVGDLQTAAVLAACARHAVPAAAGLVVGAAAGRRLEDEPLESRLLELAGVAAAALELSSSARG
jgi:nucleoside phosphorylase